MNFFNKYINNKYFYVGMIFVIWWVFFDQESLLVQYKLTQVKNDLNKQKEYYNDNIKNDNAAINTLQNDTVLLEKYAREKYYMKKDNEDVFIIVHEEDSE
ncbi:MAG: septum formation initiator family protein [Bacteroidota bacterium]